MNFFRRYTLIVGAAYGVLLILSGLYFYLQLEENYETERTILADRLREHVLILDFSLKMSASAVIQLQDWAQARLWENRDMTLPEAGLPESLTGLAPVGGDSGRFAMVQPPPGLGLRGGGQLTGLGGLHGRDRDVWREMDMALALNRRFAALRDGVPGVDDMFYISLSGFWNVYPWRPAAEARFDPAHLLAPRFTASLPGANRARGLTWRTDFDGQPEATATAPVYGPHGFQGVVGVEVAMDQLARANAAFGYDLGEIMVLGPNDTVLAMAGPSHKPAMPPGGDLDTREAAVLAGVRALPPGRLVPVDQWLGYTQNLQFAPWAVFYMVPERALLHRLMWALAPQFLTLVAGLTILLLVTHWLTRKEFIRPARLLVSHIARTSREETPSGAIPDVPPAWRPWFRQVGDLFRANAELVGLRHELDLARDMQANILPRTFPDHPGLAVHAFMRPARQVGGDFYDVFDLPDGRLALVVADVSGKGVPAGLFMMVSRTLVRATLLAGLTPARAIGRVNEVLCADNESMMFVTLFLAAINPESGEITHVSAGHNPPVRLGPDGTTAFLPHSGDLVLGVMPGTEFTEATTRLAPGEALVLYTDGITEAVDPADTEYGNDRLCTTLAGLGGQSVDDIVHAVVANVDEFADTAPQADDMTCLVIKNEC